MNSLAGHLCARILSVLLAAMLVLLVLLVLLAVSSIASERADAAGGEVWDISVGQGFSCANPHQRPGPLHGTPVPDS